MLPNLPTLYSNVIAFKVQSVIAGLYRKFFFFSDDYLVKFYTFPSP